MCGIAGLLDPERSTSPDDLAAIANRMAGTLRHRGPDDKGVWVDAEAGIAMAHRRLAVIDLSAEGHQPMVSASGRFILDFNGEIYNHAALRAELEGGGTRFRGRSDTEVLVEAVDRWGVVPALDRCNGMFALAVWDRQRRELSLARDRMGEKPLYWARLGSTLAFGSELKALEAHPSFRPEVDRDVLALYLRVGYIPAPHTIYRNVWKLAAGHVAVVRGQAAEVRSWWDAAEVLGSAASSRCPTSDADAVEACDHLLAEAVALRMDADVPVGAFLSGGVDSSVIVALMQAASSRPVRTFTVGFGLDSDPDLVGAAGVARYLGTDHTELRLSPSDALALVPRLPRIWDEPFADPSELPTALMCAAARDHVTVALSGDGGDEVFAGYNRYTLTRWAWPRVSRMPRRLRAPAGRALRSVPPPVWDRGLTRIDRVLPRALRVNNPGDKAHKLGLMLGATGPDDLHRVLVSQWDGPDPIVRGGREPAPTWASPDLADPTERMMFIDTVTTLPDEMLTKVDRASMAASLEVRVPLLDHRVVEAAWGLPIDLRLRQNSGKWVLRQVLYRHVPQGLVDRPKMGFDPPVAAWLRGPLRDWAGELLDFGRLRDEGFLDPAPIAHRWSEHQTGRRNWDYALWAVLMFEAWLDDRRSGWPPASGLRSTIS